jgi:hypothetical protein
MDDEIGLGAVHGPSSELDGGGRRCGEEDLYLVAVKVIALDDATRGRT